MTGSVPSGGPDGPLSGVRVLDFSRVLAGPFCGRMLADQGADVLKIEPPEADMTRAATPIVDGLSAYFSHLNAGKRCISVDLTDPDALTAMMSLVDEADVLIENFRPGVMDRLGLGSQAVLSRNPRILYCSISGYGQDGPWAERRCYAPVVHGEAGTIATVARLTGADPAQEALSHADVQAALIASNAISSALFARERTGAGAHIDVSLAEASVFCNEFAGPELNGHDGPASYGGAASLVLTLADGTSVVTQGNPAHSFVLWCRALGHAEVAKEDRFKGVDRRMERSDEIRAMIRSWAAEVSDFEELHRLCDPYRLAVGIVRTVDDLARTTWAAERRLVAHFDVGPAVLRAPYRTSGGTVGARKPAPFQGESNEEVLGDVPWASSATAD